MSGNGPIIVAVCSTGKEKQIAHYTVLHDSGEYELMVGQGNYYVFAYRDKNSNLVYEAGEPAGQYGDPKVVVAPDVGVVFDIDVVIPEGGSSIVIPHGSTISSVKPQTLRSRQAGAITDLDDERFSEDNGAKGFWEPYSFFKQFGGNIYFLEEYDPEKTPILFIHGAGGTPKGWWYFVENIDRTRFQPWFFYYPTGARIDSMSYLLFWKLTNLQTKYQFNTIYVTAHSMGGLVARSFIVNYGLDFPYVKLFISLATPWGGDKMAEYGVQQSPAVIPSWIDMQPEGDLIKSLYRIKMPEHISFYMFYGHRGNRNPFRSNNDGTITLSSLLDYRPQSEAKMNFAFNEDHASIIYSKEDSQTTTFLSEEDNGRTLGPFSSGDYLASIVTMAGKPVNNNIPVSIDSNKTRELNFVFIPDGVIRGCVTGLLAPEDKYVGMPDYRYRSVDTEIDIQSITLKGNGVRRNLQPIEGEEIHNYDYLISRADFCYNRCFGFFGLPAGDYKLTIKAEGYKPIVTNYSVKPGIPIYFRVTEMTPD